ncbi:unnamed protein product [Lactuca saligna]|uniref:Uncharacterized protein n=1 Tax=Lactuca saligna TaxID=75948 RepID=A0AA35ZEM3_LACSI|nr:unnamed protein product [Lactuca saligna]
MGKKGSTAISGPQMSVTIREASTGKKHTNAKSSLKLQHIKNLAMWATHDASIPSLGAFFGHHFAASSEALATPVDPSLFTCQRCETILHPGYNCTIRIEKNKQKAQHKVKKDSDPAIPTLTLLESKKKRNRSGDKKKVAYDSNEEKSVNASTNRKRRKSWTSLKEIAESNDNDNRLKLMNITIPFSME